MGFLVDFLQALDRELTFEDLLGEVLEVLLLFGKAEIHWFS